MNIEERLKRLEQSVAACNKEARRYRQLTVLLAMVIVAGVTMGQTNNYGRIECQSLIASDFITVRNGEEPIFMARSTANGGGSISILNQYGKTVGVIESNPKGDVIFSLSSRESTEIFKVYGHTENLGAKMLLYDGKGNEVASFGTKESWE